MAINSDYSTPASGDAAVFALKELAVASGWSVTASGDAALTYNGAGDVITSAGVLGTQGAWFVLTMSGSTRSLLFTRKASSIAWTIKYCPAGFTGGNATTSPTHASSKTLIDGNWLSTDGSYRWLLSFEDVAPFGFWAAALTTGTLAQVSGLALLGMEPASYDATDADPYAALATATNVFLHTALWQAYGSFSTNFHSWYRYGTGSAQWAGCAFGSLAFGQSNIGAEGTIVSAGLPSSVASQEVAIPIICGFRENPRFGIKGTVRGARWTTSTTGSAPNGTHLTDGGAQYWVRAGDLWLQWDSIVPSL